MNSIASKISAVNKCSVKNDACNIDDELIEPRLHTICCVVKCNKWPNQGQTFEIGTTQIVQKIT